mmetsp:Transcript_29827/g.41951  ORF Transcript_29827/g.41951 Transcript_29827/m.41951 type:complete len:249 (-) Transcript_29827:1797-2543(-)
MTRATFFNLSKLLCIQINFRQFQQSEAWLIFFDKDNTVQRYTSNHLCLARSGPRYLHPINSFYSLSQTSMHSKAIGTIGGSIAHCSINGSSRFEHDSDSGPHSKVVFVDSSQSNLNPVCVFESWVQEQSISEVVSKPRTSKVGHYIQITIIVNVSEADTMSLLQVTKSTRSSDISKVGTILIQEHSVGLEGSDVRLTSTKVQIEEAVIVDVPMIHGHSHPHRRQLGGVSPVRESSIPVVDVQSRLTLA